MDGMTKRGTMPKDTNQRAASIVAQATASRDDENWPVTQIEFDEFEYPVLGRSTETAVSQPSRQSRTVKP